MVSVKTVAYNHERFIARCIEGVLMQQTSFPVEHVIGDDASTDGTRQIIQDFADRYPGRIRLVTSDRNVGIPANCRRTLAACRGRYIALCDGDDFWTEATKLQRQVDFLESHPDLSFSFHTVGFVNEKGERMGKVPTASPTRVLSGVEALKTHIQSSSVVHRNILGDIPADLASEINLDAVWYAMLSGHGGAADLGFVGSNYRIHSNGCYGGRPPGERFLCSIRTRQKMLKSPIFSAEQKEAIAERIWDFRRRSSLSELAGGRLVSAFRILLA